MPPAPLVAPPPPPPPPPRPPAPPVVVTGIRAKTLNTLLNYRPNPYQSAQDFRREIFKDILLDGNAFIHFDGTFMYHLPASNVEIIPNSKTFISGYVYGGSTTFRDSEVFYFKDASSDSIYRGASRLQSCLENINILYSMQEFQQKFFDNGTVDIKWRAQLKEQVRKYKGYAE